ncbi:hydrogenase maturation protease [Sporichthya sp.]|uniref:hydrogenase maturation protease n=1 Tax=Sporichthya sp. TaxID=65475 RepID=UPI00182B3858|nr:hydrogenase maturation protease [Sporichthya sp.]MBA3743721.1 hydrogenase maturation protease [Sporichthya sp.]
MTARMLVAGVGNIFLTDDGFGSEVLRRMAGTPTPPDVHLLDAGIRGVHLAYQLLDGYEVLVVVDAAQRGHAPGTVTLVEVDPNEVPDNSAQVADGEAPLVDAHGLEPGAILSMLGSLGGAVQQVYLVACEPASLDDGIGLSPEAEAAVAPAISLVEQLMWKEVSR